MGFKRYEGTFISPQVANATTSGCVCMCARVNTPFLRLAFASLKYSHNEYSRIEWVSDAENCHINFFFLPISFLSLFLIIKSFTVAKESFVFSTVEDEKGEKLDEMFGVKPSFLKVLPSHCLMPPKIVFYAQKIRDFTVYEDDVWMVSYPRTGNNFKNKIMVYRIHVPLYVEGSEMNLELAHMYI